VISTHSVMKADTAALRAVAKRWLDVVDAVDDAVADIGAATRDLPYHWAGADSVAAQERATRLRTQIGYAHDRCLTLSSALTGFADTLDDCRTQLRVLVDEAQTEGIAVDLEHGGVYAPLRPAVDYALYQSTIHSYATQLTEILERANAAEQRARAFFQGGTLREDESLPEHLDDHDRIDDDRRDALADGSSSWKVSELGWMHPLEKERLLDERPAQFGAVEGLPSEDRDRANRILLQQEKARLQDEQALLSAFADGPPDPAGRAGPPNPALVAVTARLDAIDRLEKRLDDPRRPKAYLVDYQPGNELNTKVSAQPSRV
jgi:hypothetical protein